MQRTWPMAALAIDAIGHKTVFVYRSLLKARQAVMTAHTLNTYFPTETGIISVFETGREIPFRFLGKKGEGCLVEVAVLIDDMRIGMMAAADDVINVLFATVYRIASLESVFLYYQHGILPVGLIIKIFVFVVKWLIAMEICRTFLFCRQAE